MRLPQPNTKVRRVLNHFMEGFSSNRFEAERRLHDHCLHSTVSTLQNEYGIEISRQFETVPGFEGNPTQCCRYWIDPEERERIKKEALTTSYQTKGKGFSHNTMNNNSAGGIRQPSPDI